MKPPRGVAQSGSALGWGPSGRRFKSCLPDSSSPPRRPYRRAQIRRVSEVTSRYCLVFVDNLAPLGLRETEAAGHKEKTNQGGLPMGVKKYLFAISAVTAALAFAGAGSASATVLCNASATAECATYEEGMVLES